MSQSYSKNIFVKSYDFQVIHCTAYYCCLFSKEIQLKLEIEQTLLDNPIIRWKPVTFLIGPFQELYITTGKFFTGHHKLIGSFQKLCSWVFRFLFLFQSCVEVVSFFDVTVFQACLSAWQICKRLWAHFERRGLPLPTIGRSHVFDKRKRNKIWDGPFQPKGRQGLQKGGMLLWSWVVFFFNV